MSSEVFTEEDFDALRHERVTVPTYGQKLIEWRKQHMIRYPSKQTDDNSGEYKVNYPNNLEAFLADKDIFDTLAPWVAKKRFVIEAELIDLNEEEFLAIKSGFAERLVRFDDAEASSN